MAHMGMSASSAYMPSKSRRGQLDEVTCDVLTARAGRKLSSRTSPILLVAVVQEPLACKPSSQVVDQNAATASLVPTLRMLPAQPKSRLVCMLEVRRYP